MSASIATAKNGAALTAVSLSALMLGIEISSIPAILPTLERVLPADFRQRQWIMNAYTIAMTTCLMAMGGGSPTASGESASSWPAFLRSASPPWPAGWQRRRRS